VWPRDAAATALRLICIVPEGRFISSQERSPAQNKKPNHRKTIGSRRDWAVCSAEGTALPLPCLRPSRCGPKPPYPGHFPPSPTPRGVGDRRTRGEGCALGEGTEPRPRGRRERPCTCVISRAFITAAKLNMFPMVLFSSAASWMVLWSRAARSSVLPVQPRMSTAIMMDMV